MGVPQTESLPPKVRKVLEPLLKEVESLTEKIQESDHEIEQIARKDYPEAALLEQVSGVGPLIALTFVRICLSKTRACSAMNSHIMFIRFQLFMALTISSR
jgi:transposase